MNWIRIATGIMRDPRVVALSEAVGVSVPTTTGHVVGVLTSLPEGSATGDLSQVSDKALEDWAMWRGKRGVFAAAFRAQLCDTEGVVRAWEKYNGSALRRLEQDRERKKQWREEQRVQRMSSGRPQDETRTESGRPADVLRYETRRDETRRTTNNTTAVSPERGKPRRAGTARFVLPVPVCNAAYEAWQSSAGAVEYPRFRKAFGPLFTKPDGERPPAYPRDAELVPAVQLYLAATIGTRDAGFRTPERCAAVVSAMVDVLRTTDDPELRIRRAQVHIGQRSVA